MAPRDNELSVEMLAVLSKLDEQAENRAEERERRRMLLEAELEEKRQEQERKWIQTMLMSKL